MHTFADYLAYAETLKLTMRLDLFLGALEVGRLDVLRGVVVHAEMPGANGNEAFRLLTQLPRCEVTITLVDDGDILEQTVDKPWRELITHQPRPESARDRDLQAAFASGRGVITGRQEDSAPAPASNATPRQPVEEPSLLPEEAPKKPANGADVPGGSSDGYDELFKRATAAYLRRSYEEALEYFQACASMRPDDRRVRHNIEKLQERIAK